MEGLVLYWLFFGFIAWMSVMSFLSVWPEGDEFGRLFYGLSSVVWFAIPMWHSSLRLRIRLDGRFVYKTLLYSITFLPTDVRESQKGREWGLGFDQKGVDPQGNPSVEFRTKRWWLGRAMLAMRQHFLGNEIKFDWGTWNLDKEGYMCEVFHALREAVREGKMVELW